MNRRTLITIDWDWFIPERSTDDFSHAESPFFMHFVWLARYTPELWAFMQPHGYERFWDESGVGLVAGECKDIIVTDSHLAASRIAEVHDVDRVVLIDAHHDAWPLDRPGQYGCHNWVTALCQWKKVEIDWVRAPWMTGEQVASMREMIDDRVSIRYHDSMRSVELMLGPEYVIHTCRSGAWTPPWCDQKFREFVTASGLNRGVIPGHNSPPLDGWQCRWDASTYAEARKYDALMNANVRRMGYVGLVPASQFGRLHTEINSQTGDT